VTRVTVGPLASRHTPLTSTAHMSPTKERDDEQRDFIVE